MVCCNIFLDDLVGGVVVVVVGSIVYKYVDIIKVLEVYKKVI